MRTMLIAVLATGALAGCVSSGKAWHKEQALRECDQLLNPQERAACRQKVEDDAWKRRTQANSQ